jgi:broad specificity phosphatase PhoE
MLKLALVRHGETVGNSSIRYHGRTDVELSELGRRQMRAAKRWMGVHLSRSHRRLIIASPLRRAAEGASIIAGGATPIIELKEFVEVDFGRFEGLTAAEIEARYPADFARWNRDRLDPGYTYPAGESRREFTLRVERGIHRMLELIDRPAPAAQSTSTTLTPDEAAIVVAHRGVIRIIANRLAGVTPQIELGSIQILQRDNAAGTWHAHDLDIVDHLAGIG